MRGAALVGLGWVAVVEDDRERARVLFHESLAMASDHPVYRHRAAAMAGLAEVALTEGDAARAARLLGTVTATHGGRLPGDPDTGRVTARVREALGDAAFGEIYETAAGLPRAEALKLLQSGG